MRGILWQASCGGIRYVLARCDALRFSLAGMDRLVSFGTGKALKIIMPYFFYGNLIEKIGIACTFSMIMLKYKYRLKKECSVCQKI